MKYLEAILGFLTTIARLIFRGKGKHKPGQPVVDDTVHPGCPPSEYGSGAGSDRGDTLNIRETFPAPEKIMGTALILCATGGYLLKLMA